ncbi:MAG: hypothetical protein ACRD0D_07420, partial [Acidimicrobiales bacterium]
ELGVGVGSPAEVVQFAVEVAEAAVGLWVLGEPAGSFAGLGEELLAPLRELVDAVVEAGDLGLGGVVVGPLGVRLGGVARARFVTPVAPRPA